MIKSFRCEDHTEKYLFIILPHVNKFEFSLINFTLEVFLTYSITMTGLELMRSVFELVGQTER